jgi:preprotein translocase subunit SecD
VNKLKLAIKILAIILVCAISFIGIYTQNQNRMENQVKDYALGMNLTGSRVVTLKVSDDINEITKDADGNIVDEEDQEEDGNYTTEEEPVNAEEDLTEDNYNKSKAIIEKRLKKLGVDTYNIKVDEETGKIVLEIPENTSTDHIVSNVSQTGKFEIVDSDSKEVLIDNNDIKQSNVLYNTTTSGTVVYLNIEFNKAGKEKLKNVSIDYATIDTDSDSEDTDSEEETDQKEITMQIDDSEMISTSFDETIETGSIQLSMGSATTDTDELNDTITSATTIATILDTGNLPITYTVDDNEYVESLLTSDMVQKMAVVVAIIGAVMLIFLMFKFRGQGVLASISYAGLVAVFLLLIRYTNVEITLQGLVSALLVFIFNYVFTYILLKKNKQYKDDEDVNVMKETCKEFVLKAMPVLVLSIVFCFANWQPISSFGMLMFWGLALILIYNVIVTKSLLNIKKTNRR